MKLRRLLNVKGSSAVYAENQLKISVERSGNIRALNQVAVYKCHDPLEC